MAPEIIPKKPPNKTSLNLKTLANNFSSKVYTSDIIFLKISIIYEKNILINRKGALAIFCKNLKIRFLKDSSTLVIAFTNEINNTLTCIEELLSLVLVRKTFVDCKFFLLD